MECDSSSRRRREITKPDWIILEQDTIRQHKDALRVLIPKILFSRKIRAKPQRSEIGFYKRTFSSLRTGTSMPTRETILWRIRIQTADALHRLGCQKEMLAFASRRS